MSQMTRRKAIGLVVLIVFTVGAIVTLENPFTESPLEVAPSEPDTADIPIGTAVGQRLPNFNLETIDGNKISLSDFRDKVVFVNFWATWCPFCVDEMPDLQKIFDEGGGNIVVLGINRAESLQKQKDFLSEELEIEITYPLLLDPSDGLAEAFGVRVMPTTFILDGQGVIVQTKLGQFATIDELREAIKKPQASPARTAPPETPRAIGSEIDSFDLEQVLMAKEGDVVGLRGEKLVITNGIKHIVPLNKILSGGPPPDGIPPIENPKYISPTEANQWLADDEFVLGIVYAEIPRAYPLQILVWHEIVNDNFNGKPLLVTYCPLCFTGIAFEPFIGGEPVTFGTSGKLFNSDLVMYDRKTSSYWSQITGQAIRGELSGLAIKKVPIDTIRWGDWKEIHPDTQVLSQDTGPRGFPYGQDPYGSYFTQGDAIFPVESDDTRLPAKAIVYGVFEGGLSKAYPEEEVAEVGGIVNDVLGSLNLLIVQDPDQITKPDTVGTSGVSNRLTRIFDRTVGDAILEFEIVDMKLFDEQTGSQWSFEGVALSGPLEGEKLARIPSAAEFWFAWSSFNPDTEIFQAKP